MSRPSITMAPCLLALIALLLPSSLAYSSGAPDNDALCNGMRPGHHTTKGDSSTPPQEPQTGAPWFALTVSKHMDVMPDDVIQVTIDTIVEDKYIEGFMIQVGDKSVVGDNPNRYGTFELTDGNTQKLMCNDQAVTHVNIKADNGGNHLKWDNITLNWKAPAQKVENVVFRATVVKNYATFFMNVESPVMNENNSAPLLVPSLLLLVVSGLWALGN